MAMQLSFTDERVLAVVAHPDDAELLCAGTLARAKSDGAPIGICVLCQGDKGQPTPPIDNLVEVRREELKAAAELLGCQLFPCEFLDGELFDGPEARRVLVEVYREFRPSLVLAHSPLDYHPDHRAAGSLAEAGSWLASSAGHKTTPPALPTPSTLWWMDTINMSGFAPHFYIDVSDYVDLKRRMLACHRSQLQRGEGSDFSPLEELMLRQSGARGDQAGVAAAEAFRSHTAWKRTRAW
jgi:LmbE family N-acetylglucosaminyl deacetylase